MLLQERLADFYTDSLNGDKENLLSLFSNLPKINTPFDGQITGKEEFLNFMAD